MRKHINRAFDSQKWQHTGSTRLVDLIVDSGSTDYHAAVLGILVESKIHHGKIVAYFAKAAARHKSHQRTVAQAKFFQEFPPVATGFSGVHPPQPPKGFPHTASRNRFRGRTQARKAELKTPCEPCDGCRALAIFPRPDFGRDVIVNRYTGLESRSGHLEVERRVINQNEAVGLSHKQRPACRAQIGHNLRQIAHNFAEPHIGHFAVVYKRLSRSGPGHAIATKKSKNRIGVAMPERFDKIAAVKVAGGFAGYEEIVHLSFVFNEETYSWLRRFI